MAKFPVATGKRCVRALKKAGFLEVRTTGSHLHLTKSGHPNLVTVPMHSTKSLKRKTLKSIIVSAGLSIEEFRELL